MTDPKPTYDELVAQVARLEQQRAEREESLCEAQRLAHLGSWDWVAATDTVRWSDELYRINGRDPRLPPPRFAEMSSCYTPESWERLSAAVARSLRTGEPFELDLDLVRRDGATRRTTARGAVDRDASGTITGLHGTVQDITERWRAEEELRESLARLRVIAASTPDHLFVQDRDLRYTFVLPPQFGLNEGEVLGRTDHDLVSKEDADRLTALKRRVLDGGLTMRVETPLLSAAGERRYFDGSYVPKVDADGRIDGLIGYFRDVTDRKRVEEELRNSDELFSQFLRHSPIYAFIKEVSPSESRVLRVSENYEQMIGISAADMVGKTMEELFPPDLAAKMTDDDWATVSSGEVLHVEEEFNGRNYASFKFPILLAGRALLAGYTIDVTERTRAEEALRQSEQRYHALFEHASDGIFIMDVQGNILEVNEAFARSHGYSSDELLALGLDGIDVEGAGPAPQRLERLLSGEPLRFEVEHRRKDGSRFPLEVTTGLVQLGEQQAVLAFHRDITERRRAEEERAKLAAQFEQAQKMESIGRLAGGVAHDFNNMLSIIIGNVELARTQVQPSQPLHADLTEIRDAAERAADLTRRLLAFARKQTVAPRALDLNHTVSRMLKMLRRLLGEDLDLVWRPQAGLWPVSMDPAQVDQLLTNLCVNARDAIAGVGKVTIETVNRTVDADYCAGHAGVTPGDYVLLAVSDDGCGIDEETRSHVFEPFFTTKGLGQGTGLGLAMVYGVVKQNSGFVNVYSEPGQGTTFSLYFPRHAGQAGQARVVDATPPAPGGQETILLVEDEPSILKATQRMLERRGYTVVATNSASEAIRIAREHSGELHLLLTDVIMPEMNGRDLARNVLAIHPGVRPLYMSGYPAGVVAHRNVLDDGVSFLQKPFSIDVLAAKVREVLDGE